MDEVMRVRTCEQIEEMKLRLAEIFALQSDRSASVSRLWDLHREQIELQKQVAFYEALITSKGPESKS